MRAAANAFAEETYHIYRQFPNLVTHVVSMEEQNEQKFKAWAKTKDRPWGIPHWKVGWRARPSLTRSALPLQLLPD